MKPFLGVRLPTLPDWLLRLILVIGFLACLLAGSHVLMHWARVALLIVAAGLGLMVLAACTTQFFALSINRIRWYYKAKDEASNTFRVPNSAIRGSATSRLLAVPAEAGYSKAHRRNR